MKIQTTAWDIIVTSYIFIKVLVAWMYKELLKLNSEFLNGQKLEETIHQEYMKKANKHMKKCKFWWECRAIGIPKHCW